MPFHSSPARPPDRVFQLLLVWTTVLMTGLLGFIWRYGPNMPVYDEWPLLSPLVGEAAVWQWLWAPHSEHLYPLPRLVWYVLHRVSGYDFRTGMVASVLLAGGSAVFLLAVAARLRGRSHPADALVPSLLLHLGHWENWLLGYQVAFTLPLFLAAALVWLLTARPVTTVRLVAAGMGCLALGLCGGGGVLLSLPFAVAVAAVAVSRRSVGAVGAAAAVGYAVWYMAVRPPCPDPPPPTGMGAKLVTLAELSAGAAGFPGRDFWPWSCMAVGLAVAALARLVFIRCRAGERARLVWLGCGLTGAAGIAAAIAVSRTGMFPQMGLSSRYALFTGFGLSCLYVAARPVSGRVAGPAVAVLLVGSSIPEGLDYGHYFRHAYVDMRTRIRAGAGVEELTAVFVTRVYAGTDTPHHRDAMRGGFEVMARHRIGPYRPAR